MSCIITPKSCCCLSGTPNFALFSYIIARKLCDCILKTPIFWLPFSVTMPVHIIIMVEVSGTWGSGYDMFQNCDVENMKCFRNALFKVWNVSEMGRFWNINWTLYTFWCEMWRTKHFQKGSVQNMFQNVTCKTCCRHVTCKMCFRKVTCRTCFRNVCKRCFKTWRAKRDVQKRKCVENITFYILLLCLITILPELQGIFKLLVYLGEFWL